MNPHDRRAGSPAAMVGSFVRHRYLLAQLTKREVISRYRGSVMGLAWSFFNPLLMLAVYTFFFSVVFKARWAGEGASRSQFAVFLFVGIIVHGIFAECVNRAPTLILANANYVKRVVFPIEIFPWVAMGSALFHASVSGIVLLGVQLWLDGNLSPTICFLPLVLIPLIAMTMGIAWFLAALGVFVRDIGQITVILTTVLLFLSPVFYPITAMPDPYRAWMMLNPLTFVIEQARNIVILDGMPDWTGLGMYTAAGVVVAWIGFWTFQRLRNAFADVL